MMIRIRVIMTTALLVATMGVSYGQQQPQGKPLRIGSASPLSFDGMQANDVPGAPIHLANVSLETVFELAQISQKSNEAILLLKHQIINPPFSYTEERDGGKTFYAELRPNILFHDGSTVTMDDVEFTLQYWNRIPGPFKYLKFKKLSASAFTLSSVKTELWHRILDCDLRKKVGKVEKPVSAGPYILVSVEKGGKKSRLIAFDKYFLGPPPVREIEYTWYDNLQMAMFGFLAGETDYQCGLNKGQVKDIGKIPGIMVKRYAYCDVFAIWFNLSKPPMDDIRVRKAISLLIDPSALVANSEYLRDSAIPTSYEFATSIPVTKPHTNPPNPAEAYELLKKAGYVRTTKGWAKDGKPIRIVMQTYSRYAHYIPEFRIIKKWLDEAGLSSTIKIMPNSGVRPKNIDEYDLLLIHDYDKLFFFENAARYTPGDPYNYFGSTDPAPANLLAGAKSGSITPGEKEAIIQKLAEYHYTVPLFYTINYCVGRVGAGYEDLFFKSPMVLSAITTPSDPSPGRTGHVANGH